MCQGFAVGPCEGTIGRIDWIRQRDVNDIYQGKPAFIVDGQYLATIDAHETKLERIAMNESQCFAAAAALTVAALALPSTASAGCYSCYTPPPCYTCYQRQVAPPQYRAFQETVQVSPGGVIAHRTPAQYRTVMVPQTILVVPEGVRYQQIPAQYATRQRIEMVAPAREYYVPQPTSCASCDY